MCTLLRLCTCFTLIIILLLPLVNLATLIFMHNHQLINSHPTGMN